MQKELIDFLLDQDEYRSYAIKCQNTSHESGHDPYLREITLAAIEKVS